VDKEKLLAYKPKEERLVDTCDAKEVEFESKQLWNLLLLAHSTPGSIPAMDGVCSSSSSQQTMKLNTLCLSCFLCHDEVVLQFVESWFVLFLLVLGDGGIERE